ncbi:hypothetical protein K1S51_21975, partial [Klebsiella pneumoniae]|nr:hypothetical protein [Klebsiella pneumoniae]
NTQNSRHRYAASTSGNPSFSVLRQLQYLCELTQFSMHKSGVMVTSGETAVYWRDLLLHANKVA